MESPTIRRLQELNPSLGSSHGAKAGHLFRLGNAHRTDPNKERKLHKAFVLYIQSWGEGEGEGESTA